MNSNCALRKPQSTHEIAALRRNRIFAALKRREPARGFQRRLEIDIPKKQPAGNQVRLSFAMMPAGQTVSRIRFRPRRPHRAARNREGSSGRALYLCRRRCIFPLWRPQRGADHRPRGAAGRRIGRRPCARSCRRRLQYRVHPGDVASSRGIPGALCRHRPRDQPACASSGSKRVSVLGTKGTVKREYTQALIRDFAQGCRVTLVGSGISPPWRRRR